MNLDTFLSTITSKTFKWYTDQPSFAPESFSFSSGKTIITQDIIDNCISNKRNGSYQVAINDYIFLLDVMQQVWGKSSPGIARGLFKCLMASNDYYAAWTLASNVLNAMKKNPSTVNPMDYHMTIYYLQEDVKKIKSCISKVLKNDYNELLVITQQYSGDYFYQFVKSKDDIRKEFLAIDGSQKHK